MGARLRRREREWLGYLAGLLNDPLTEWPDEQVGRLLNENFAGQEMTSAGLVSRDL